LKEFFFDKERIKINFVLGVKFGERNGTGLFLIMPVKFVGKSQKTMKREDLTGFRRW